MIQTMTNIPGAAQLVQRCRSLHDSTRLSGSKTLPTPKFAPLMSCSPMNRSVCRHPTPVASASGARGRTIRAMSSNDSDPTPSPPAGPVSFLSLEEAGLVEMSGLEMHEKFLARLTISSLNLLRVISEQENIPIVDLNSGRVCDWFIKDKEKRVKDINTATLKWE